MGAALSMPFFSLYLLTKLWLESQEVKCKCHTGVTNHDYYSTEHKTRSHAMCTVKFHVFLDLVGDWQIYF